MKALMGLERLWAFPRLYSIWGEQPERSSEVVMILKLGSVLHLICGGFRNRLYLELLGTCVSEFQPACKLGFLFCWIWGVSITKPGGQTPFPYSKWSFIFLKDNFVSICVTVPFTPASKLQSLYHISSSLLWYLHFLWQRFQFFKRQTYFQKRFVSW